MIRLTLILFITEANLHQSALEFAVGLHFKNDFPAVPHAGNILDKVLRGGTDPGSCGGEWNSENEILSVIELELRGDTSFTAQEILRMLVEQDVVQKNEDSSYSSNYDWWYVLSNIERPPPYDKH